MIPILFASNASDFTKNGIGRLSDAISCEVHEVRNGEFELEMEYPVDGAYYSSIVHSAIIVAKPSARRSNQAFRIYKITKPLSGKITVLAQHISYQLSFIPVAPFTAVGGLAGTLAALKSHAVESCPFTLTADFTSAVNYSIAMPKSLRSCLGGSQGSVLDVYGGGEWEFDNYSVILHRNRGQDSDYTIEYGKNLIDLTQEQNIQNVYTGVYPYYKTDDAMTVLTTEPKVIRAATAANFPFQRTVEMDFTDKFDTTPTEAALRSMAEAYVAANHIGIPNVSISLDFVNLADTVEYKHLSTDNVDLCDLVTVRFAKLGISVKSKIVSIEYDVLRDRYSKLEIGERRASLAGTIADEMDQLAITPTTAQMHRSIDMATGVLNKGQGGYVIYNRNADGHPNETLYLDENSGGNLYASQHVLRINYAGIGFSGSGYGGPYSQSWDLLGHLTLGGINNSYGDFTILDEHAVPVVQMDKRGLILWNISATGYMYNGVLYADADHTSTITPTTGYYYYDVVDRAVYMWNGSAYVAQSGSGGINAQLTHDGLSIYKGTISGVTIDIARGNEVGLYCDGERFQFGDFEVNTDYGRQILESTDEMTGMGGEPDDDGGLYLWAGYRGENDYAFVVNDAGAYTMYNGTAYNIGQTLHYILENCCGGGGGGCDDCDSYGCDDEGCPGYGGEGCIPESAPCVTEPCSSEGGCGPCDSEGSGCDSCDSESCDSEQCGPGDGL